MRSVGCARRQKLSKAGLAEVGEGGRPCPLVDLVVGRHEFTPVVSSSALARPSRTAASE